MSALRVIFFIAAICVTGYEQYLIQHPKNFGHSIGTKTVQNKDWGTPKSPQKVIVDPGLDAIGQPKDGKNHPCYRPCQPGNTMTCYYKFHVEWYYSMSKACKDCPVNATACGNPDCVPANGIGRPITVVNRKMPGPAIQICKNDRVVVDVENDLMASGTTIHWHGLHQKDTPYMDGVPFVTQCPIQPESTFRYEFSAPQAGTYFWHSHIGLQRGDGTTGALIVREPLNQDPHRRLYDFDNPEHVILVTDWLNNATINLFTDHHHSSGDNRPGSILINGIGRFNVTNMNGTTAMMKAPVFEVERGSRYRFRLINGEYLNCPVELSVDGHNITVIATDGSDLVPITASTLVSYAGERYDFIINADKAVDNYWIRVRGLLACESIETTKQVAVLRYKGAKIVEPPAPNWNETRDGLVLNAVNVGEEQNTTRPVATMRSLKAHDESLKAVPDHKFFIAYDMYLKNNVHFHRTPYYGVGEVDSLFHLFSPQLNHISMKLPKSPLLVQRPSSQGFCNESTVSANCKTEFCECSHVLNVKLNSVVEIIIIDEGVADTNHPFHLHGYSFRVVGQRRLANSTTIDQVRDLDKAGKLIRNLQNAPVKDTVTTPEGGYTIIRFVADNPGYWLFHCHIEFHAEVGMSLVFKVGEHKDMKPVPPNFPMCGDYKANNYKFL